MSERPKLVEDRKRLIEAIAKERRAFPPIILRRPDSTVTLIRKGEASI